LTKRAMDMKKWIISLGVIVLVVGVALFIVKGTIRFSLFQIYRSVQDHDVPTFEYYVDIDSVLDNLGDDYQKLVTKYVSETIDDVDDEWATIGMGMASFLMPKMIEEGKNQIKREIIRQIEQIDETEDEVYKAGSEEDYGDKSSGEINAEEMFNKDKFKLKGIFSFKNDFRIKQEGKIAYLKCKGENGEIIIHMRNMPGRYWRVVRMELPDLLNVDVTEKEDNEDLSKSSLGSQLSDESEKGDYEPRGYVNDFASVLTSKDIVALKALCSDLEKETTVEMAIVTVNTTNPKSIGEYAGELFSEWGIGKKDKDNGVLILLAVQDRKVRIEVGYGLEGVILDNFANSIIEEVMVPELKKGQYYTGLKEAAKVIVSKIKSNSND